jgi:hypothetical protein
MPSDSRQSQLLSLISTADLSSYYGIAIASAVVAGSALYYYVNNKSSESMTKSELTRNKRKPLIDFKNQTKIVSI